MATFAFGQANGTTLSSIDAKWSGGSLFEVQSGVAQPVSGQGFTDPLYTSYQDSQPNAPQYIEALWKSGATAGGQSRRLAVQFQSTSTRGYECFLGSTSISLSRNGSFINSASTGGADITAADVTVRIELASGSGGSVDVTLKINGGTVLTYNDTAPLTGGYPAIGCYAAGTLSSVAFDNIDVADSGGGGGPTTPRGLVSMDCGR